MLNSKVRIIIANDEEFSFVLVRQKEYILTLINDRKSQAARAAINIVEELWIICSYEYKTEELRERIKLSERSVVSERETVMDKSLLSSLLSETND